MIVTAVSVPFRGFRGLQELIADLKWLLDARVSVPFRGFRGLQVGNDILPLSNDHVSFQSPSGVLGVCRLLSSYCDSDGVIIVSVPFRGFRGLQADEEVETLSNAAWWFQSPSGVLGVCRSGSPNPPGWCGCPTLPGLFIPRAF